MLILLLLEEFRSLGTSMSTVPHDATNTGFVGNLKCRPSTNCKSLFGHCVSLVTIGSASVSPSQGQHE